jgi:hypothetical protein
MLRKILLAAALASLVSPAFADSFGSAVGGQAANQSSLSGCIYNSSAPTLTNGQQVAQQCDVNGNTKTSTSASPSARTIIPLDVSTVTTGGTAVTALIAGHRTEGGFLFNPVGATISLCINEQGTASGTTSSGALTCIQPGQSYTLTPAAGAVSVITSDSSHPFSGYGLN